MHNHPPDHDHAAHGSGARALGIAAALTGGMMLAEFVGGWWANSLALISDAGHMLTDVGALLVSLAALVAMSSVAVAQVTIGFFAIDRLGLDHQAGAVARQAVGIDGAPVGDVLQRLDGVDDHLAARLAVDGGDEAHATGVLL